MATDEFGGIAVDEPKPQTDAFGGIAIGDAPAPSPPKYDVANEAHFADGVFVPKPLVSDQAKPFVNSTTTGGIMKAFGHDFGEAFGAEQLGLSPEGTKWLSKIGIFAPEGQSKYQNPFQAFNEGVLVNTAAFLDGAIRTANGVYRGLQGAGVEAGRELSGGAIEKGLGAVGLGSPEQLARDVVSIPDALMGSPHPTGMFKQPALREMVNDIKSRSGIAEDAPVGEAKLPPSFDAYHGSPFVFDAFSTEHIGAGEGAQAYGHGLYFAENPKVAAGYRDTLSRDAAVSPKAYEDPVLGPALKAAEKEYEDANKKLAEVLNAGGDQEKISEAQHELAGAHRVLEARSNEANQKYKPGALYQVKISADQDRMLDWDKPIKDQSPYIRDAMRDLGVDENLPGREAYRAIGISDDNGVGGAAFMPQFASDALHKAGIPGIKYLDAGSRNIGPGEDLGALENHLKETNRYLQQLRDSAGELSGQAARYRQDIIESTEKTVSNIEKDIEVAKNPTRNLVVFNENDIQITHKNGEPVRTAADIVNDAKDLGVIGDEKPSLADMKDKPVSEAVDALRPKPDGAPEAKPAPDGGWRDRFEHFVGKLTQPEEIRQLIRDSADENSNFPEARAPADPLSLNEAQNLADAAGMEIGEVDRAKLGKQFNEAHVDRAMQVMIQATRNVKDAARDVVSNSSEENLIKFQEHLLRRDMAVEEIVGIRSTWGRIGNTLNKYVTEVKDGKALDSFIKETCPL